MVGNISLLDRGFIFRGFVFQLLGFIYHLGSISLDGDREGAGGKGLKKL